ncbi:MAG: hypothetical protein ACFFD7_17295 [Candidatus Thorarchaeota archaeon]
MREEFNQYLKIINVDSPLIYKRIEELIIMMKNLHSEEIYDILIGEYINKEGERVISGLGIYSENFVVIFGNFLHDNEFSIYNHKKPLKSINIISQNYDFLEANQDSKLAINLFFRKEEGFSGIATGINCDYLKKIVYKYFINSLR